MRTLGKRPPELDQLQDGQRAWSRIGAVGARLGVAGDGQQPRCHHKRGDDDCGERGKQ